MATSVLWRPMPEAHSSAQGTWRYIMTNTWFTSAHSDAYLMSASPECAHQCFNWQNGWLHPQPSCLAYGGGREKRFPNWMSEATRMACRKILKRWRVEAFSTTRLRHLFQSSDILSNNKTFQCLLHIRLFCVLLSWNPSPLKRWSVRQYSQAFKTAEGGSLHLPERLVGAA